MKDFKKLITDGPVMKFLSLIVLTFATLVFFIWDTIVLGMRVKGRKHLRSLGKSGYIVISNHTLFLEPGFITHALFPMHPYFSIMEQTFVNPAAEWGLRLLRGFPIPRRNGIERIKPEISRVLKGGGGVHFFPEGSLTHFGQTPASFKKGAFLTAIENQVPLLPVVSVIHPRKFRGRAVWNYLFRLTLVIEQPIQPPPCPDNREDLLKAAGEMAREAHRITVNAIDKWGS